jgi:hypothetical protein
VFIHCHRHVFSVPVSINGHKYSFHYSSFQPSLQYSLISIIAKVQVDNFFKKKGADKLLKPACYEVLYAEAITMQCLAWNLI